MLHSGFKKPNVVSELNQDRHRELRRIMLPAFSQRALQEQESVMSGMVDKWLKIVSQEGAPESKGVEVGRWFALDALDILGELAFGESFGAVATGEFESCDYVASLMICFRKIGYQIEPLHQPLRDDHCRKSATH